MKHTNKEQRPKAIRFEPGNIPSELIELPQWVLWKFKWKDKEESWAKVPIAVNGGHASVTDPTTWATFESCKEKLFNDTTLDGMGFVFSKDDPYIGVDFDNCVSDSVLDSKAAEILRSLNTYEEYSPSRTGVHAICKGSLAKAARGKLNGLDLEVYDSGRFFTFTGRPVDGAKPITERTMAVRRVVGEIEKGRSVKATETFIERQLRSALEKPHIRSLFEGDISEYAGQSEADLALCAKLAPYAGGDRVVLDGMLRQSALFRGKWDEMRGAQTYGQMTLEKALGPGFPTQPFNHPSGEPSTKESRRAGRFTVDSLWDRVMDFRKNGDARGYHPGWDQLEKLYRPTLGSMTVLLGEPGAGKSTWIDALAYNMCKEHNWRITMASFESLPIERHINNLCQMYLNKPTYTFLDGHASDKEMEEARVELNEWFNFISPADDDLTMETMLKYVEDDIEEWGVNGFVLDPWTEMDIRAGHGSEVDAIKNGLKRLQQFTRIRNIHSWLLVHPTKSNKETYREESRGLRPTLYSASGAAHFRNKALALDTQVPTPSGWTTMGEIKVGDVLFDNEGKTCTVTNTTEVIENASCYRMRFKNGAEVVADAGHLWETNDLAARHSNRKSLKYGYKLKPTTAIRTTEEIAATVLTKDGNANHRVPVAKPLELPKQDLLIPPYTLGAWLGDGRNYDGQFTSIDVEVIDRIRQDGYTVNQHSEQKSWGIQGLKIQLRQLGLTNNKHIPAQYLRGSYEQRLELVRGLMDTDGCAEKDTGWCIFINTNKAIATGLHELLGTLGIKASITESTATLNGNDYGIKYTVKFTTGVDVFSLPYKRTRQQKAVNKTTQWSSIVSVEPTESVPVRCIEVDSPDHMFLITNHFVPTHNCDFGLVIHRWNDETVSLYVDKVRNAESSGAKGVVDFKFDTQRRLYVEEENDTW